MAELKPCPFCGNVCMFLNDEPAGKWVVNCLECQAIGPVKETEEQAISAWNKRS